MKMMNENITGACDCSMHIKFNLHHKIQFYHYFSNVFECIVENASDQSCGQDSIDVSSMTTKMHAIENAFVWTGPYRRV